VSASRRLDANNLPRVVTQPRPGRGSNSRPLDHKSDALPLRNHATSPALMCLEHVLYPSGRRGGGCGRRRRSEDGATVGPNDVSDLYTPNGVMAHRHLFYLYNVFYVDTILNILCILITASVSQSHLNFYLLVIGQRRSPTLPTLGHKACRRQIKGEVQTVTESLQWPASTSKSSEQNEI